MGVDIIEAGFPDRVERRFRGRRLHRQRASRTPRSAGSPAPSRPTSPAPAKRCATRARPRIHTFVSTSPIHLAHQMRKTEDEVIEIITATVTQARNLVDDVEWSADGRDPHVDRLSLPLRRGGDQGRRHHHQPARHGRLRDAGRISRTCSAPSASASRIPTRRSSRSHCHDDLGLAVANSLAGIDGGARQVECTINGIGERAGNAALEEIVMAIRTRSDVLPYRDRHRRDAC